jgi:sugar phosphate isomerase/epimerase
MTSIPVALQLYSLREMFPETPLKTLRTVKEMGFSGVEFYGAHFKNDFYRALLAETGLVCAGWHTPMEALEGDNFEKTLERNLAVGNKYICVPSFCAEKADDWKAFANRLNLIAEKLRPYNIRTGFHCHALEFVPVDGELPWTIIAENTIEDVVLQLDTGNALSGGADLLETLKAFPGRNQTIHWKPYSAKEGFSAVVGEDDQDWEELLRWSETKGRTEWIVLEYEKEDPVAMIRKSMDHIKEM